MRLVTFDRFKHGGTARRKQFDDRFGRDLLGARGGFLASNHFFGNSRAALDRRRRAWSRRRIHRSTDLIGRWGCLFHPVFVLPPAKNRQQLKRRGEVLRAALSCAVRCQ